MGLMYNTKCDSCGEIKPIISSGTVYIQQDFVKNA